MVGAVGLAVVIMVAEVAAILDKLQVELGEGRPRGNDPLDTQMTKSRLADW